MFGLTKLIENPVLSVRPLDRALDTTSDDYDDVELDLTDAYDDDESAALSDAYDDDEQLGMDAGEGTTPADSEQEEDPDRQGAIRVVKNAHLIYKRKDDNNMYTELWVYKQDMSKQISSEIYNAIIAGTDIPKGSRASEDGSQTVKTWEIGPPESTLSYVEIKGIPN